MAECSVCKKEAEDTKYWGGKCFSCYCDFSKANERRYQIEDAISEGEGRSEDGIICPYCGDMIEDDLYEYRQHKYRCDKCNKQYELEVEYKATFITRRIVEEEVKA